MFMFREKYLMEALQKAEKDKAVLQNLLFVLIEKLEVKSLKKPDKPEELKTFGGQK